MSDTQSTTIYSVRLRHVRLYDDVSFEFDPGVNIIVGPNASGKTTILEALTVLARGQSYKAKDVEVISFDHDWARIDAGLDAGHGQDGRTVKLQRSGEVIKKQFEISERKYARLTYHQKLPLVLFEPNHLLLLTTQPELRRGLLDDLIEQTQPNFANIRKQYKRCLAQRNALLKGTRSVSLNDLFVWNLRLSEYGGAMVRARLQMLGRLNEHVTETYSKLAGTRQLVALTYDSACSVEQYETDLLRQLEARFEIDRQRGFTGRGPHRDDMVASINGHTVQAAASRGEARTLTLTLKILEARILEEVHAQKPLLLLDDVFSELDGRRRRALTGYLRDHQTFITTTDADVVVDHFGRTAHIIALS
jgi:DNA replication and repair protein RecF